MSRTRASGAPARSARVQLHLELPYKFQPREHPRIRSLLDSGYRLAQLQRITDREVVVTLVDSSPQAAVATGKDPATAEGGKT